MKNKIKPISNLSLVDRVELSLREYFENNDLMPGDPIPKEVDLAESLGVSRTVVREAILRLRTLGLIESKKHRGMILTEPDILMNLERVLNPKILGEDTLRDIFELRLILEVGMADFLFRNKTDKQIDELLKIVEDGESSNKNPTSFSLKHEIEFHGKLYEISGNQTLKRFQSILLPVFEYVDENHLEDPQEHKGGFVTHRNLLEVLQNGTPSEFREQMQKHLEPHFERSFR